LRSSTVQVSEPAEQPLEREPVRCRSPHICRRAKTGDCEDKRSKSAPRGSVEGQECHGKCIQKAEREQSRMREVWMRMSQEQTALKEARGNLVSLTEKGTTEMWRLRTRMTENLKVYERKIAEAAGKDNKKREKWEEEAKKEAEKEKASKALEIRQCWTCKEFVQGNHYSWNCPKNQAQKKECGGCASPNCPKNKRRAALLDAAPGPAVGARPVAVQREEPAMVRRIAPTVLRSRDGTTLSATVMAGPSAAEIQALKQFSDSKVTKLVTA